MTSSQQRSNRSALSDKGGHVLSVADCKNYAEILGEIPAFSNCSTEVLEEFVAYGVEHAHYVSGEMLPAHMEDDPDFYVVVDGSATLDAGDDVRVTLTAGDYFGRNPGRSAAIVATVIADVDVDVLIIHPEAAQQLERAAGKNRHPSQIEWRSEFTGDSARPTNRRLHSLVAS
jgi:hypothetical protein